MNPWMPSPEIFPHRKAYKQFTPQAEFDSANAASEQPKIAWTLAASYSFPTYLTTLAVDRLDTSSILFNNAFSKQGYSICKLQWRVVSEYSFAWTIDHQNWGLFVCRPKFQSGTFGLRTYASLRLSYTCYQVPQRHRLRYDHETHKINQYTRQR